MIQMLRSPRSIFDFNPRPTSRSKAILEIVAILSPSWPRPQCSLTITVRALNVRQMIIVTKAKCH